MMASKIDCRMLFKLTDDNHGLGNRPLMTLRAVLVMLTDEGMRNPSYSSRYSSDPGQDVADLELSAQCELTNEFYGMHFQYASPLRVDEDRAKLMHTTLRRINQSLAHQYEQYGQAADVAAYAARCAVALRCRAKRPFGHTVGTAHGWSYDENQHEWMDVDNLRHWLATQVSAWHARHGITSEVAGDGTLVRMG
jgi:hypothetical protein